MKWLSLDSSVNGVISPTDKTCKWQYGIKMVRSAYWSSAEKTPVKQSMKCKVCLNFPMSFFSPKSDRPPRRGIWWPRMVLSWVQLTWFQMYPPVEASSGQEQYIRPAWHLVSLWVSLTFGQMYTPSRGPVDLSSDVPPGRGIWWPRMVLSWVQLMRAQMYPGRGI